MSVRQRLDVVLADRGLCPSRRRAQTTIMSGLVYVDGQKEDKPGLQVAPDAHIEVRGDPVGFVSRGGLKLSGALDAFALTVTGQRALDAGASTGGFTDCLLQRGAARVWAVDVGYGQLDWRLRQDDRVVVMERMNIRNVTPDLIGQPLDIAVLDLSFISLRLVLPVVAALLGGAGQAVCLVKPQFEAGRGKVGKKGVVRDRAVHLEVLRRFADDAAGAGMPVSDWTYSSVQGPQGNIEFFAHLSKAAIKAATPDPEDVVERAHVVFSASTR